MPCVDATCAVGVRRSRHLDTPIGDTALALCLENPAIPGVVGPHRIQLTVVQSPLAKADDRLDEVRHCLGLAHRADTGSLTGLGSSRGFSTGGGGAGVHG